ncbi:MAG: hypothetical protein LLF94_02800 [Chlamydiales bacterium]|nr:hypothetical protein [Chlamydiales bacterium]
MIDIKELKAASLEVLKKIYVENRDDLKYMLNFGTDFEKAVALLILTVGGEEYE